MKEKNEAHRIRFLRSKNELFVAGKTRLLAHPDEVKCNIHLQIQSGEVDSSGWSCAIAIFMLPIALCGLGFFALTRAAVLEGLSGKSFEGILTIPLMGFFSIWGGLVFLFGAYFVGKSLYDYLLFILPMNLDAIYTMFKWRNLMEVKVSSIAPLSDTSYVRISYIYYSGGSRGNFKQGHYLATQPIDLAVDDYVYIVQAKGIKIIL